MNPPPLTSDCCKAAPLPDTLVDHCVPGLTWGRCSCCLRDTLYKLPVPPEPPSRSGAGVLIGVGLFMVIACGCAAAWGPGWLAGLTGVTAAACGWLAWKQGV
jgi:hypothetical protein